MSVDVGYDEGVDDVNGHEQPKATDVATACRATKRRIRLGVMVKVRCKVRRKENRNDLTLFCKSVNIRCRFQSLWPFCLNRGGDGIV